MGFLKKLVKKAVKLDKKAATRPFKDAKKAISVGNKLSGRVGGPKVPTRLSRNPKTALGDLGVGKPFAGRRGGGARPKAPPVSSRSPAPRPTPMGGGRPMGGRPIGRGRRFP